MCGAKAASLLSEVGNFGLSPTAALIQPRYLGNSAA